MSRVNSKDVERLVNTFDVDSIDMDEIEANIETAAAMIEGHLSNKGLSEISLIQIEKYLAAHFYSIKHRYFIEEEIAGAKGKTGFQKGAGLRATPYGETAIGLDSTGTLSKIGTANTVVSLETD